MTIHNFSPGPAALPKPVLQQIQRELLDWQGRGYSVMEVSHRSPQYMELVDDTTQRLHHLLNIPDTYAVLYLGLAATAHFALLPVNLCQKNDRALYLNTGHWSKKASAHAGTQVEVQNIAIDPDQSATTSQALASINPSDFAYAHFCPNETIEGIAWPARPELPHKLPLIGDFSSCLLSCRLRIEDYALIYAGAQKNLGPAGISLLIMHKGLLGKARHSCPPACNYELQEQQNSLLHTPNTFGIYVINLVCRWIEQQGGLAAMEQRNRNKAALLYQAIDNLPLYHNYVPAAWRSTMNIPFKLADPQLDKEFLVRAEAAGLLFLKGHRAAGGMRASLYNAVATQSVETLVDFMHDFAHQFA